MIDRRLLAVPNTIIIVMVMKDLDFQANLRWRVSLFPGAEPPGKRPGSSEKSLLKTTWGR
jgi:hypothetical protein